jgi:hypothetical protein
MKLIGANGIVAVADLQVAAWRVTLLRCFWKREHGRDRIGLPCNGIRFENASNDFQFQRAAFTAMRELAKKILEDSAP